MELFFYGKKVNLTRAVLKPEIIPCLIFQMGYFSWCMLGFHSVSDEFFTWTWNFFSLTGDMNNNCLREKWERMWNIYIWKPHGDDRRERESTDSPIVKKRALLSYQTLTLLITFTTGDNIFHGEQNLRRQRSVRWFKWRLRGVRERNL